MDDNHNDRQSSDRSSPSTTFDRPKRHELRLRNVNERRESLSDYTNSFEQLQIKPSLYEKLWTEVIYVVRQKQIDILKRGTEISIKTLTALLLRGFGYIVWPPGSTWLIDVPDCERLVYKRGGENKEYVPQKRFGSPLFLLDLNFGQQK